MQLRKIPKIPVPTGAEHHVSRQLKKSPVVPLLLSRWSIPLLRWRKDPNVPVASQEEAGLTRKFEWPRRRLAGLHWDLEVLRPYEHSGAPAWDPRLTAEPGRGLVPSWGGAWPSVGLPAVLASRVGGRESKDALCWPLLCRLLLSWL